MTKQISLTQGLFATVDDTDFEFLNQWKWCAHTKDGKKFYAVRSGLRLPFQKTIYMHRVIMNTPDDMDVDHRDGNGLNNTRGNLRNCTNTQNQRNREKLSNNTSGYKGVTWNKEREKWVAQIKVNGKLIRLGRFSKIEDAAHAYDQAAKKYFGEFARTNF